MTRSADLMSVLSAVPLHLGADRGVRQLQVAVLAEDRRHSGGRPVPQGPGGQQQRHAQAAEDEQLPSRLARRYRTLKDASSWRLKRKRLPFVSINRFQTRPYLLLRSVFVLWLI